MRCKYCGSRIHVKDEVCKGCSAPVPTVNYAAGWALFLSIISLLFSVFGALNLIPVLLTVLMAILGFHKAKIRGGKGRKPAAWAVIFLVLAVVLSVVAVCFYQMYQQECLDAGKEFLDSLSLGKETGENYWDIFQQWFGYISLQFLLG